jgi:hypothetical protein
LSWLLSSSTMLTSFVFCDTISWNYLSPPFLPLL